MDEGKVHTKCSMIDAAYAEPAAPECPADADPAELARWAQLPPPVDAERWPQFSEASGLVAVVKPGDILFIPAFYWHWVFSDSGACAVNFWVSDECEVESELPAWAERAAPGAAPHCQVVQTLSQDEYAAFRARREPVLLSGRASLWPALTRWSGGVGMLREHPGVPLDRFLQSEGQSLCPVEKPHPHYGDTGESARCGVGEAAAATVEEAAERGRQWQFFLRARPTDTLLRDIRMPPCLDPRLVASINVWCNGGPKGVHTGLHFDGQNNLLVGVKGVKRVLLFPQSQTRFLYNDPCPRSALKVTYQDMDKSEEAAEP